MGRAMRPHNTCTQLTCARSQRYNLREMVFYVQCILLSVELVTSNLFTPLIVSWKSDLSGIRCEMKYRTYKLDWFLEINNKVKVLKQIYYVLATWLSRYLPQFLQLKITLIVCWVLSMRQNFFRTGIDHISCTCYCMRLIRPGCAMTSCTVSAKW